MAGRGTTAQQATEAHKQGKFEEAMAGYAKHLAVHPEDAGIWSNLGALLRAEGKHRQALRAQERAHRLRPDDAGISINYANILSDLGGYDDSRALRVAALERNPDQNMQYAMIGRCFRGLGQYEDAITFLSDHADRFEAEPEIELQLAFAQLGAMKYGAAFRSYQARWRCNELTLPTLDLPRWQDGDPVAGKSILIVPEQGFGDGILFSRFVSILAEKGAKPYFLAEKPTNRLLKDLEGAEWVGTAVAKSHPFDFWMNLMDMPLVAYAADEDGAVPPPTKLSVPEDSRQRAQVIAAPYQDVFKVGVVWSGSATYKGNSFRSFSHTNYLPLCDVEGAQLFSLYKGPFLKDYFEDGSAAFMIDTASSDRDFADCAATMLEMDLVITSDTATAHIAGSLGIPCWVILHWDPFWVYRHSGETTAWYPSMRLFRQKVPLEWDEVFAQIRTAMIEEMENR